jgi:hypothetical protein
MHTDEQGPSQHEQVPDPGNSAGKRSARRAMRWLVLALAIPAAYADVPWWSSSEPVVMVVPPEVPNPTMDRGCWIRLTDGPAFSGQSFVLVGPAEMRAMDLQAISRFRRRVSSAETGPDAVAQLFAREDFSGAAVSLGPSSRNPHVAKAFETSHRHVEALRLSCTN